MQQHNSVSSLWNMRVIHGFFQQAKCSVFGKVLTITLIARRSRYFAGTRYRKRGLNDKGCTANDVEAEQVVECEGVYTSYVQVRASIPLFWTQEGSAMVAKPPIVVYKHDPLHIATRLHFEDLFARYGSPVMAVNLVRQKESRRRETIIGERFTRAVEFINSHLPAEHEIDYLAWDFKKVSKSKQVSVVDKLATISEWVIQRSGIFSSCPNPNAVQTSAATTTHVRGEVLSNLSRKGPVRSGEYRTPDVAVRQSGVLRVNCIDSLDRTNVAQFCVGKRALTYQLHALHVIDSSDMTAIGSSGILTVLLDMYEQMGDCIALQYGGSQMHRQMKKDEGAITSAPALSNTARSGGKGKEMFVSIVRHLQNSYKDHEKQDSINVFLGLFKPTPSQGLSSSSSRTMSITQIPDHIKRKLAAKLTSKERGSDQEVSYYSYMSENGETLWDLEGDFYLHNARPGSQHRVYDLGHPRYSEPWWLPGILKYQKANRLLLPIAILPDQMDTAQAQEMLEDGTLGPLMSSDSSLSLSSTASRSITKALQYSTHLLAPSGQCHYREYELRSKHGNAGVVADLHQSGVVINEGDDKIRRDINGTMSRDALEKMYNEQVETLSAVEQVQKRYDEVYAPQALSQFDEMLDSNDGLERTIPVRVNVEHVTVKRKNRGLRHFLGLTSKAPSIESISEERRGSSASIDDMKSDDDSSSSSDDDDDVAMPRKTSMQKLIAEARTSSGSEKLRGQNPPHPLPHPHPPSSSSGTGPSSSVSKGNRDATKLSRNKPGEASYLDIRQWMTQDTSGLSGGTGKADNSNQSGDGGGDGGGLNSSLGPSAHYGTSVDDTKMPYASMRYDSSSTTPRGTRRKNSISGLGAPIKKASTQNRSRPQRVRLIVKSALDLPYFEAAYRMDRTKRLKGGFVSRLEGVRDSFAISESLVPKSRETLKSKAIPLPSMMDSPSAAHFRGIRRDVSPGTSRSLSFTAGTTNRGTGHGNGNGSALSPSSARSPSPFSAGDNTPSAAESRSAFEASSTSLKLGQHVSSYHSFAYDTRMAIPYIGATKPEILFELNQYLTSNELRELLVYTYPVNEAPPLSEDPDGNPLHSRPRNRRDVSNQSTPPPSRARLVSALQRYKDSKYSHSGGIYREYDPSKDENSLFKVEVPLPLLFAETPDNSVEDAETYEIYSDYVSSMFDGDLGFVKEETKNVYLGEEDRKAPLTLSQKGKKKPFRISRSKMILKELGRDFAIEMEQEEYDFSMALKNDDPSDFEDDDEDTEGEEEEEEEEEEGVGKERGEPKGEEKKEKSRHSKQRSVSLYSQQEEEEGDDRNNTSTDFLRSRSQFDAGITVLPDSDGKVFYQNYLLNNQPIRLQH